MNRKSAYDNLLHEICVGLGWCGSVDDSGSRHVDDYIPDTGPVTAEQFANWVLAAEGEDQVVDPEKWQTAKDRLRDAFIRHMGGSVVDAGRLK